MKKVSEVVQRIESHYVGDDCIQVMVPYKNTITILNRDGIIYSHKEGVHTSINKYLEDERRKQFPYSNIPTHYSRFGLFGKINYANQLLNFEEPYIRIGDGGIVESFAVKDKNEALLINKILIGGSRSICVTRAELEELFSKSTREKERKFIIYLDDESINTGEFHSLASEEKIYNFVKSQITENIAELRKYVSNESSSMVGWYLLAHPLFLDFVEQSIQNFDLNNMRVNVGLRIGEAIIVRSSGSDMIMQYVDAKFISLNNYKIDIIDIPVNKYTLEQLKHLSSTIAKTKEPRIPLRLNPAVSRQDIQEAKQMIKSLRK